MSPAMAPVLGVLGGMGPLATADFYQRLIALAGASRDQDHLPVIICADPRIPDRTQALFEHREGEVLSALLTQVARLEAAGAGAIAIPCNTAHHWLGQLSARTPLPFLSMPEAVMDKLARASPEARRVAILATRGTVRADVYGEALARRGLLACPLSDRVQQRVDATIAAVKSGRTEAASSCSPAPNCRSRRGRWPRALGSGLPSSTPPWRWPKPAWRGGAAASPA